MRVLAIDTALEACSAAVLDTERDAVIARESLVMTRGHAEALMPLIARVMEQAALDFPDLDRIAVTNGPGSFTGLRVGIAAARGIGLATGKPVVGVTTLAALAAPLIAQDDGGYLLAAIDARHAHVYMQFFGPQGHTLVQPRLAPVSEAITIAAETPVRLVGSGASLLAAAWTHATAPALVDPRRHADIDWVAWLGAAADESQAHAKPFYLQQPDARPQHASQIARQ